MKKSGILKPLGKENSNVSKEEQRNLLPSSTDVTRCSSLDFKDKAKKLEEIRPVLKSFIVFLIDQEINKYIASLHEKK